MANNMKKKPNFFDESFDIDKSIENEDYVPGITNLQSNEGPVIDNADVVYEEKANQTFMDKVRYFFSTLNTKVLIIVGIFVLILIAIRVFIAVSIAKDNASYKAELILPDIVYMGESSNVYVKAQGKKGLDKTVTTFESNDTNVVSFLKKKVNGKEAENVITPVNEGRVKVKVKSVNGKRNLLNAEQEVVVCPEFKPSIYLYKTISIVSGSTHDLGIDFGEEECSKGVKYESLDTNIMAVDDKGVVTGIKEGITTILIKKDGKNIAIPAIVTKEYIPMTSLSVVPDKVQLFENQNMRFKIEYAPLNATNVSIKFYTGDANVATVSNGGFLKAVGAGQTNVNVVTSAFNGSKSIPVVVSKASKKNTSNAAEINLNKSDLTLVQGTSEKIEATIVPDDEANKTLKWSSEDESIASVDKNGVIYGNGIGSTVINVSTLNGVSRTVTVKVIKMKTPTITSSDNIGSGSWHNSSFVLNFDDSEDNVVYYYGKSADKIDQTGQQVTVSKDESVTYYVQGCRDVCKKVCDKNKKNCKKQCKKGVCSDPASYLSKLDTTKPKILSVQIPGGVTAVTVQMTFSDTNSLVKEWCVNKEDRVETCKWNTISVPQANPVIPYTVNKNGSNYVFIKDSAGNTSDSYLFRIETIQS